jgi:hypothetical protein
MILNEDYFDRYENDDFNDADEVTGDADAKDITP